MISKKYDSKIYQETGALIVNTTLKKLDLWSCDLKAITELVEVLKANRSLSELDLCRNEFGNTGGQALAGALKVNKTLIKLGLERNGDINDEIRVQIATKIISNEVLSRQTKEKVEKEFDVKSNSAASATAVTNKPIGTVLLDRETLEKLKDLPGKHEALSRQIQKLTIIDTATLQVLQGRANQLLHLFEVESKAASDNQEKALIKANPHLQIYYQFFARPLNGTWMACQTINSRMVGNAEMEKSDYVGQGLDQIGQRIPGISMITGFFSGVIAAWNFRDRQKAVQRMTMLFPDLETAFSQLGQFVRQATLAQGKQICSMPAPQSLVAKMKEGVKDAGAFLLGTDDDSPLKRKAEEDCKKLLTAIKDGKLPQHPTLEDLLMVIMGAGFKYQPPAPTPVSTAQPKVSPPSSPSATSPVTSQGQDANLSIEEMAEELRKIKLREADREAEVKKVKEKLAKLEAQQLPDESNEFGVDEAQRKVSKSKQAATAASGTAVSHSEAVAELLDAKNRHAAEIATLKAKQNEHADEIDTSKAKIDALKARKTTNESCSIW